MSNALIKIQIGDLFIAPVNTLVNTVNCIGVMGKGIALTFKKRFPEMYKEYKDRCKANLVAVGEPYLYKDIFGTSIINFPTKNHWRSPSRLEDIVNGLNFIIEKHKTWGLNSVAFPPLGCGNGGLDWEHIGPIMYQKLSVLEIPVFIYAPYGTKQHHLSIEFLAGAIEQDRPIIGHRQKRFNPDWVALLEVINQLHKQTYANPVGRTIFQKICYVMTELGVDTGFYFKQGNYGPFSADVKKALSVFANSNLIQERQLGKMTEIQIGSEFEPISRVYKNILCRHKSKIEKTVDLFSRIKNTNQAEEVTTVFYAARKLKTEKKGKTVTEKDLFDYIVEWKKDWKTRGEKNSIAGTIRNLEMLGWIKLQYSHSLI